MVAADGECSQPGDGHAGDILHFPGIALVQGGAALLAELRDARATLGVPFRVAACGLLNAGKSSLLNALTDRVEAEVFATGAARTTTASKVLRRGGVDYVDTPGLDATAQDDEVAWRAIREADLLMFVHDPQTGELHGAEIDFLSQLAASAGAGGSLSERLIVVLTHLDSWGDAMDATASAVARQVEARLGFVPRLFSVSSVSYRRGRREGKAKLVGHSGVPALREHLQLRVVDHGAALRNSRRTRMVDIQGRLLDAVDREIAMRDALRSEIARRSESREQRRDRDFAALFKNIAFRISRYRMQG